MGENINGCSRDSQDPQERGLVYRASSLLDSLLETSKFQQLLESQRA